MTPSILLKRTNKPLVPRIPPRKIQLKPPTPPTPKNLKPISSTTSLKDEVRRLKVIKRKEKALMIEKRKEVREKKRIRKEKKGVKMMKLGLDSNGLTLPLTSEELSKVAVRRSLEAKESLERKQHSIENEKFKRESLSRSRSLSKSVTPPSNIQESSNGLVKSFKSSPKSNNTILPLQNASIASSSKPLKSNKRSSPTPLSGEENIKLKKKIKRSRSSSSGDSDEIEAA